MKLAWAMIVKGDDREAILLDRCLKYVAPFVDGLFITITQENEAVRKIATKYNVQISSYVWDHNFAKARNFSFAQVSKDYDYIGWCDADDVIRGMEKLRATIEEHPNVDCFTMNYLYDFDEYKNPVVVHLKSRVLRNDGCVEWQGALHEDFKKNRDITAKFVKGIEVLHLTEKKRIDTARDRNVEVALRDLEKNPDDPRSYWNLGNSYLGTNKLKEAVEIFKRFIELSHSEDEKYIVYLRMAEAEHKLGNYPKALEHARYAIGTKPLYPDAYNLAGYIYFDLGRYFEARDSLLQGLTKKPPYYSIIVYNPRDYDYNPLMALAKTYIFLHYPQLAMPCLLGCIKIAPKNKSLKVLVKKLKDEVKKAESGIEWVERLRKIKNKEKLKAEFEKVPVEVRSYPHLCLLYNENFIKTKSSGKDIVFFCGLTTHVWTPETAVKEGVGGSEEAVINLSRELVRRGWNVTVYNNCGHREQEFEGVKYKPFWAWNHRDVNDVFISWRSLKPLDYEIKAKKIFVDLHDVIGEGEFTEKRLAKVNKIFVKSKAHRNCFPLVKDEKFVVVPNGLNLDFFQENIKRDQYLMVNTSSADRSLKALADCFIEIKKRVPKARVKWAYGWGVFDTVHGEDVKVMKWKRDLLDQIKGLKDFEMLGKVSHREVAKLYQEANIFAYPCEFYEIDCISARKAQLAGAYPITTNFAALDETVQFGVKIRSKKDRTNWALPYQFDFSIQEDSQKKEFIENCVKCLNTPLERREEMKDWAKQFTWSFVTDKWEHELL